MCRELWNGWVVWGLLGTGTAYWRPEVSWRISPLMPWLSQPAVNSKREQHKLWMRVGDRGHNVSSGRTYERGRVALVRLDGWVWTRWSISEDHEWYAVNKAAHSWTRIEADIAEFLQTGKAKTLSRTSWRLFSRFNSALRDRMAGNAWIAYSRCARQTLCTRRENAGGKTAKYRLEKNSIVWLYWQRRLNFYQHWAWCWR